MELEKKSLSRREWKWIEKAELVSEPLDCPEFSGVVGLLHILTVATPLRVPCPGGLRTIGDVGYRWLQLAPRNAHWWLTVLVDREDCLIESYFDITRENDFSDPLSPFFFDMKLDVAIPPRGTPRILDADELKEALDGGCITEREFYLAHDTAEEIISWYESHREEYYACLSALYRRLTGGRELRV